MLAAAPAALITAQSRMQRTPPRRSSARPHAGDRRTRRLHRGHPHRVDSRMSIAILRASTSSTRSRRSSRAATSNPPSLARKFALAQSGSVGQQRRDDSRHEREGLAVRCSVRQRHDGSRRRDQRLHSVCVRAAGPFDRQRRAALSPKRAAAAATHMVRAVIVGLRAGGAHSQGARRRQSAQRRHRQSWRRAGVRYGGGGGVDDRHSARTGSATCSPSARSRRRARGNGCSMSSTSRRRSSSPAWAPATGCRRR